MMNVMLVFIGGGLGAVCRYGTTVFMADKFGSAFPYGTFTANTLGSFLMGFITFMFILKMGSVPEQYRLLLAVGFLGGFTTFSSFALETLNLCNNAGMMSAVLNIAANIGGTLLAVLMGMMTAKLLS